MMPSTEVEANIVTPLSTPKLANNGLAHRIEPAAEDDLVASLAAKSDAAYFGYYS
jgi:hypothetical protein